MVSRKAGVEQFKQYEQLSDDIDKMAGEHAHSLFAETYSSQLHSTLADTEALGALLDDTELAAGDRNMPTHYLVRAGIEHSHNAHASRLKTTFGTTVAYSHFLFCNSHRLGLLFAQVTCVFLIHPCAAADISRELSLTK